MAVLAASLLNGQQTQNYTYTVPTSQVVTTTQVDPNNPPPGYVPGTVVLPAQTVVQPTQVVGQPIYQYQNAPLNQPAYLQPQPALGQPTYYQPETVNQLSYPTTNPYAQDYSYGQSAVQYAQPILPLKPYVPYAELSPPQNAYPLAPYTTPQENQVNQQFMQRYSQQGQDFIRSQFGYPQTFIDPNAGLPPLGRPIRYNAPLNLPKSKANGKSGKGTNKKMTPSPLRKTADTPTYFFPGMVALHQRLWVGSDYLFYVPANIGVVIELIADKQIKNDEGKVILEEIKLKKAAEAIFQKVGINPQSYSVENTAPLPFFHILIMMYHVDNKVFVSIAGRLFEEVMPARLDLDAPVGTFQAITWEKNEILIVSTPQAPEQIEAMVSDIATTFVNRYRFFAELELDENSPDDLRDSR